MIKLLECNPPDLSVNHEDDDKRHQLIMNAMLFLFRSIDLEDWKDINLDNLDEKMLVLDRLKKKDF